MLSEPDVVALVHRVLERELPEDRPIAVLEAGGGSDTKIRLCRETRIVAFDNNPVQLDRNRYADEKILGDLESAASIAGRYDLVVCWNVLEHLRQPAVALDNLAGCLADGGFLLIGCPERRSLKGLITRLTPHRVHVWYYRHVCGHRHAGEYGYAPFPTILHRDISMSSVRRRSQQSGLEIVLCAGFRGPALDSLRRKSAIGHAIYQSIVFAARIGTLCMYEPNISDYVILLRKKASQRRARYSNTIAGMPRSDRRVSPVRSDRPDSSVSVSLRQAPRLPIDRAGTSGK